MTRVSGRIIDHTFVRSPTPSRLKAMFTTIGRPIRRAVVAWLVADLALALIVNLYGQRSQVQHADVIVVLGAGLNHDGTAGPSLERRARYAATLWKDRQAPAILCTGGLAPTSSRSEAAACREVLVRAGVAATTIHLEAHSHSTEENALHARPIVRARGWRSSLLVTDPFHMLRAHWIFSSYGITHARAPVPGGPAERVWYVNRLVAREVVALQWLGLKKALGLSSTSVPVV